MAITEPGVEEVEQDIVELLRAEEIGSLAVVGCCGIVAVRNQTTSRIARR